VIHRHFVIAQAAIMTLNRLLFPLLSDPSRPQRRLLCVAAMLALTMLWLYISVLNAAMARGGLVRETQASSTYALTAAATDPPPQTTLPRRAVPGIAVAR
jgi:hypothetical protein